MHAPGSEVGLAENRKPDRGLSERPVVLVELEQTETISGFHPGLKTLSGFS